MNVITWLLGSTAVLFVIARLTTKVVLAQRIRIDDGLLILALVRLKGRRERERALLIATKALQRHSCSRCIAGDNAWWSRSTQVDSITSEAHGIPEGTKTHRVTKECSAHDGIGCVRWRSPLHTFIDVLEALFTHTTTATHSSKVSNSVGLGLGSYDNIMGFHWASGSGFPVSGAQSLGNHEQSMLPYGIFQT